jgi:ferredoxin-NADP reductase
MNVFFERREELAPNIWQYFVRPERPVDYIPGQYVDLHMLHKLHDPRGPVRTFTLTSLPNDALLSFVVKIVTPMSPFKQALQALSVGDELRIDDAMGDLVLPKATTVPLVFIAGGIGMSSYAGMLSDLLARREEREIYLFYALKSRRERIFQNLTDAYPVALQTIVIAPNRLDAAQVTAATPPDALVYISGSQRFVEGLRGGLESLGTPRSSIIFDYYDGYTDL